MLSVENLSVTARMKGDKISLPVKHVCLSVTRGEKLAIVGQSGCGKTMTAMAILGLLPDNCVASGRIMWDAQDLLIMTKRQRRALLGKELVLIPQSGADFLNPSRTVGSQMKQGLRRAGLYGCEPLHDILHRVGFKNPKEILASYPFQLSGGMAQRVVMAIAAIGQPSLVIADEPTRGVDQQNTVHFIRLMQELFSDAAVLLITHDISVAAVCDRIMVMKDGEEVECGKSEQILCSPQQAYTQQLIRDLPNGLDHAEGGYHQ